MLIYESFTHYKSSQLEACKGPIKSMALETLKQVSHNLDKDCIADSLILGNNELHRWVIFKSIDLGYIRNVEMMLTWKAEQPSDIVSSLKQILLEEERVIFIEKPDQLVFKDTKGCVLIDDRYEKPTKTTILSLYTYDIRVLDGYLILSFKESIPRKIELSSKIITKIK